MEVVALSLVVIAVGAFVIWRFVLNENGRPTERYEEGFVDHSIQESELACDAAIAEPLNSLDNEPLLSNVPAARVAPAKTGFVNRLRKTASSITRGNQDEFAFAAHGSSLGSAHDALHEEIPLIGEEKVVVVYIKSPSGLPFDGKLVKTALLDQGLLHGEMGIFHFPGPANQAVFSIASAVEPGTFDLSTMGRNHYPGLSVFLQLPGPQPATIALDSMLQKSHAIGKALRGSLLDSTHSTLTQQTIAHLRSQMLEYQRKVQIEAARMHA